MSQAIFPLTLPGLLPSATLAPRFSTRIQSAVSGRETRAAFMAYPLWDITVGFEFLRAQAAHPELDTIVGFFLQMKGSWDNFLVLMPNDNAVADMQFGIGDGTTRSFQLSRARGAGGFSFTEPCQNIASTTNIKANGTVVSSGNYSIGSSGMATFVTAPAAGAVLTWSGSFYYRCRFLQDQLDFDKFMLDLWEAKKVRMVGAAGNRV